MEASGGDSGGVGALSDSGPCVSVNTSESSSLTSSPCVSPSSSNSSSQYPTQHEGDLLATHDRVGSVQLLTPSHKMFTDLLLVDRYALTDKPIPP